MKSWIKVGLAGGLVLMAGLWGGSVRAAGSEYLQPRSSSYGMEHCYGQSDGQSNGESDGKSVDSSLGIKWESQGSAPESGGALAL
ncbi:Beta-lactamase precursor [compost metagenome]